MVFQSLDPSHEDATNLLWNGILTTEKELFVLAPAHSQVASRESFVSLLDFTEELGTEAMTMAIHVENPRKNDYIKACLYYGFQLLPPKSRNIQNKDYVLLSYEF